VRVFALIFFLLAHVVPSVILYSVYSSGANLPELARGVAVALICLAGLMAFIAALAGRSGDAGKTFGAVFAIGYAALAIFIVYGGVSDFDGYTNDVLLVLSYFALYLGWAFGRPLRGRGYFGLPLLLVVGVIAAFIEFIPGIRSNFLGYLAIEGVVFALSVWIVVGLSVLFEGKPTGAASRQLSPASVGSANRLARLAMIFALGAIGLQVLATVLTITGLYFMSIFSWPISLIALILAIVFGHIGLYQIRRTGEQGRGQALAGLIISYTVIGLGAAALVVQLGMLALVSSSYVGD